jgi:hypothetical protein
MYVFFFLQGYTKLLVGCGYYNGVLNSIEVVDISSPTSNCNALPNYPEIVGFNMGGLFNNTSPIICGGSYGTVQSFCLILDQNTWIPAPAMLVPRTGASMTKYPSAKSSSDGDLMVLGGNNQYQGIPFTIEVFGSSGWVWVNAQLPGRIEFGCVISVNETTILYTGGNYDSKMSGSSETFWFDTINEKFSPGPTLNFARAFHGCGIIKDSNKVHLIIAGGSDGKNIFDSTEILELGSNNWLQGPKLPIPLQEAPMVEDHRKNRVLLVGGGDQLYQPLDKIYQLTAPLTNTSQWEELPQKLVTARRALPVAFFIPDHFADCHEIDN